MATSSQESVDVCTGTPSAVARGDAQRPTQVHRVRQYSHRAQCARSLDRLAVTDRVTGIGSRWCLEDVVIERGADRNRGSWDQSALCQQQQGRFGWYEMQRARVRQIDHWWLTSTVSVDLITSPKVQGYGFVATPSPRPGEDVTPFVTWGDVESTPLLLDPSLTPRVNRMIALNRKTRPNR
jgi:hypothetical protein